MANLSNINNKFIVTDGGNVLIGQTNNSSGILQIKDTQTSSFNDGLAITRNNPKAPVCISSGKVRFCCSI